nr:UvrD-helicase domain-containing protein [Oscillospiraceae bacterium]
MNWTNEQEQAITVRGKSMIVSASAGSGKTAVLVERLLRILSDME